ncbi:SDR family NAD(P)-dependent oxidoreductase [Oscillatoria amoena NRMC-F 0135]|nr:SDR family NAD(P)-dependent oxidoreductase [Oscillatoria amoena NRMC-F 0135]
MRKKTVIITGAGGNLGKVAVTYFLNQGWRVIATVSPGKSLEGFNSKNLYVNAIDLTDEEAVAGWIQSLIQEFQQLHAALLLAGGFDSGTLAKTTRDDLRKMFMLNFETAYHVARPVFLHMKQCKTGRLVFIGSKTAVEVQSAGNALAYAISKAQLVKLAEYLHTSGKDYQVGSYCLVPEIIDTPDNRGTMPGADHSRWIKPEKMAEVMLRLCDDTIIISDSVVKLY